MKLTIIKVGRPAFSAYEELVKVYQKRLSTYLSLEEHIIRATDEKDAQRKVDKLLPLQPGGKRSSSDPARESGILVALDETGRSFDSPAFARQMGEWRDDARIKTITFLIGGPYGIAEAVKGRADLVMCLSPLVFTSDMAWLIIWEQIYRAFTILHNQSYHHE